MNKEQLTNIKNAALRTIAVLDKEKDSWNINDFNEIFRGKLDAFYNNVIKACNGNEKMALGVLETAIEEYFRDKMGDVEFDLFRTGILNEIKGG